MGNSNLFGLTMFSCGMNKKQIESFSPYKILLTTVCENVPQLSLQLFFMIRLKIVTGVVLIATFSSVFNILLSIMDTVILRSADKNKEQIQFEFTLSWTPKPNALIVDCLSPYSMVGQRK